LVLVRMMSKMLNSTALFVRAITGRRRPGKLERQQQQQTKDEQAAHVADFNRRAAAGFEPSLRAVFQCGRINRRGLGQTLTRRRPNAIRKFPTPKRRVWGTT
jgi:plasmid stabilization system protein ParE